MITLAFVDVEITELEPGRHEVLEIGLVLERPHRPLSELHLVLEHPRVVLADADPVALGINRYHEWLTSFGPKTTPRETARAVALALEGATLVASHVEFDAAFLERLLSRHAGMAPTWQHRKVDLGSLAMGALGLDQPPNLGALLSLLSIEPGAEESRHTALGDARLVHRCFERLRAAWRSKR